MTHLVTTLVESWHRAAGLDVLLKREDLNPSGSHKDRAATYQVAAYHRKGARAFVISSSGNGAIATAAAASARGCHAYTFLSPKTPRSKVFEVLERGGMPIVSQRPKNLARYVAKRFGIPNLRPTTCDLSVDGFASLGHELVERWVERRDFDSVFIFSSSGSSLLGLGRELAALDRAPELHVVQAGPSCPIAREFDAAERLGQAPRTGALCAKETRRAMAAKQLVRALDGDGWIVTDDEVDAALEELSASGRAVCREAAGALAAADRAKRAGRVARPLVVLTGKAVTDPRPYGESVDSGVVRIDDYLPCMQLFDEESERW